MKHVDLRSDTVTRPTQAMRRAMAEAEVGDDVLGEDPTANRLEQTAAEMIGKEAALFVPSGTMGNQIGVLVHTRRGDEVICPRPSHLQEHEVGAAAVLSGVTLVPVDAPDGQMPLEQVEGAIRTEDIHHPRTGLLWVECPHSDGAVPDLQYLDGLKSLARRHGLPVHMDGARIFNAALALGVEAREIASRADTVMFCLSKGLGAPVGSVLCGPKSIIDRARKYRKMLGGGMRQIGILAAAGLYALSNHILRLVEDHRRARRLESLLQGAPGLERIPGRDRINMAWFRTAPNLDWNHLLAELARRGVLAYPPIRGQWRLVTHLDVDDEAVDRAAGVILEVLDGCSHSGE